MDCVLCPVVFKGSLQVGDELITLNEPSVRRCRVYAVHKNRLEASTKFFWTSKYFFPRLLHSDAQVCYTTINLISSYGTSHLLSQSREAGKGIE